MNDSILQQIVDLFESGGQQRYGQEDVTQLQHALQCAQCAVNAKAAPHLVAAALLHDIGHLLADVELPRSCADNLDDLHEQRGWQFLSDHFGARVADPVRLHVVAKRYLCTKHPQYESKLSPTSRKSYRDQGGEMSDDELSCFENEPHFREALQLRHWDDTAKDPSMTTPELREFLPFLHESLERNCA